MEKKIVVIFFIFNIFACLFSSDTRQLKNRGFQWGYYAIDMNIDIRSTPEPNGTIICKINKNDDIFVNEDESTDDWLFCFVNKYSQFGYCKKQYFERKKSFSSVMYSLLEDNEESINEVKNHKVNSCYMDDIFYWFESQNEENLLKMVKYAYECGSYETKNINPIILATQNCYSSILTFLLDKPEFQRDVNSLDYDQFAPPLFWALEIGNKEITELLLQYGADPNFNNFAAYDTLDKAVKSKYISIETENELQQLLFDYGYKTQEKSKISIDKRYFVKENLRLRKSASTSGAIVITLQKGSPVKIKSLGKYTIIDGIKNRWVYIETQDDAKNRDGKELKTGTSGWCFGGYLE